MKNATRLRLALYGAHTRISRYHPTQIPGFCSHRVLVERQAANL